MFKKLGIVLFLVMCIAGFSCSSVNALPTKHLDVNTLIINKNPDYVRIQDKNIMWLIPPNMNYWINLHDVNLGDELEIKYIKKNNTWVKKNHQIFSIDRDVFNNYQDIYKYIFIIEFDTDYCCSVEHRWDYDMTFMFPYE
jgi:hypothetical protein